MCASLPWLTRVLTVSVVLAHQLRALQASLADANARAFAAEQHVQRLIREQAAKQADAEAAVITSPRARQESEALLSPADVAALQAALKEALSRAEAAESTLATQQAWHASELEAVRAEAARQGRELEGQLKGAQAAANAALAVADRARRDASSGSLSAVVAVSSGDASPGGGRLAALSAALEAERQRAAQAEAALRRELEWATAETEAQVVMAKREVAMQAHEEICRLRAALATYEEQLREARSGGVHVHGADAAAIEAGGTADDADEAGAEAAAEAAQGTEAAVEADAATPAPEPVDASHEAPHPDESRADAPDDLDTEPAADSVVSGDGVEKAVPITDTAEAEPPDVAPDPAPGDEQQADETEARDAGHAGEASDEGARLDSEQGEATSAGPHTAAKPAGLRKYKPR